MVYGEVLFSSFPSRLLPIVDDIPKETHAQRLHPLSSWCGFVGGVPILVSRH